MRSQTTGECIEFRCILEHFVFAVNGIKFLIFCVCCYVFFLLITREMYLS